MCGGGGGGGALYIRVFVCVYLQGWNGECVLCVAMEVEAIVCKYV